MDALTAVLKEMRFESVGYRWIELEAPFALDFSQHGLRGVHAVHHGVCELVLADGATRLLRTGDIVVLPRGDSHVLRSVTASEAEPRPDGGWGGCTLLCGAFVVRESEHPVLGALPHVIDLPRADEPAVGPLIDALGTEARDGTAGSEVVMARLSDALVVQALRHHARTAAAPGWLGGILDPQIAPVLAAIHSDPGQPWTVDRLATMAHLSRATFSARFTSHVGQPAMRYVTSIRMQRARTLLRDDRLTVAAVAARLGYGSEVSFAAAFKRTTGHNPGSYRRDVASGPEDPMVTPLHR
jgi:AraC-like DNA-binding protein